MGVPGGSAGGSVVLGRGVPWGFRGVPWGSVGVPRGFHGEFHGAWKGVPWGFRGVPWGFRGGSVGGSVGVPRSDKFDQTE